MCSYSLFKCHIVEKLTQPKPLMTVGFCFPVNNGPIFESSFHHINIIHLLSIKANKFSERIAVHLPTKVGSFLAKFL